jgi:adenine-specific DNA-methyltransferase
MRYIGNKTRLLPFIVGRVERLGLRPGSAHDAFAGTAAVAGALKALGWRVASSDLMTYSYVFQRAYVVANRVPSFARLREGDAEFRRACRSPAFRAAVSARGDGALAEVAEYLSAWLEPEVGFFSRSFGPAGGRLYFTDENAGRIDAVRRRLHEWRAAELISEDAFYILLASLIEGADRVANTAGVYAAFIKSWQPNATKKLLLAPVAPRRGARGSTAHRADAVEVARDLGAIDLVYVDPPYNARQYAGYYHVPEVIARGWFGEQPVLAGKTGLLSDPSLRSDWCSPSRVEGALRRLLEATGARHVLVSYNSEGLLGDRELRGILADASADGPPRRFARAYRRYRADSDHERRRYRGDSVRELLYYVRLRA